MFAMWQFAYRMRILPDSQCWNFFSHSMAGLAAYSWKCRSCGSDDIVEDHSAGDLVCRNCGLVAAERICHEGEDERHFESEDVDRKHNEVTNELTDAWDTSTRIQHNGSITADELRGAQRASKDDSAPMRCFMEVDSVAGKVPGGVPAACRDKAKQLAKVYLEHCANARGTRLRAVGTAALYLSLTRFEERPNINFAVMAQCSHLEGRVVMKYAQRLEDKLRECGEHIPAPKKRDFLGMFIDALGLPYPLKAVCEKVFQRAMKLPGCNGKNPEIVAAAALFFYMRATGNTTNLKGEKVTPEAIASVSTSAGTANAIVNCCANNLEPYRTHLLAD